MASIMESTLPIEIFFKILCFLNPLDVVRLRTVSKQIRDISNDSLLWKKIYLNATLPRPPGPFPFQSTQFLENTLVQSARAAKSWTTESILDVPTTTLRVDGLTIVSKVICGRWFLTLEPPMRVVLRNIDSGSQHQIIWEDSKSIFSWDACSITFPEGQRVYVTLYYDTLSAVKLLEFYVNEVSGNLVHCASLNIPASNRVLIPRLTGTKAPFLYLLSYGLIFDTRTRILHQFPIHPDYPSIAPVVLTATHVLIIYPSSRPGTTEPATIIHAYAIPSDPCPNDNSPGTFRLTHAGIISKHYHPICLIRNSNSDPTDGSIKMRILVQQTRSRQLLFSCMDLILHRTTTRDDIPISIDVHDAFTIRIPYPIYVQRDVFVDASDDGHARGFCAIAVQRHGNDRGAFQYEFSIVKFTIDASTEKCVAVVGEPSMLEWHGINVFDGVKGKVYSFRHETLMENQPPDGHLVIRSKTL